MIKLLVMTFFYAFAAAVGDEFELIGFLNGRSSANFTHRAHNIIEVLPKGTKGKVFQIETLPSGNTALRVEVSEGSRKGRKFWIYFDKKNPSVTLKDKNSTETKKPEQATRAEVTRDVAAVRDVNQPEEVMITTMQLAATTVESVSTTGSGSGSKPCATCNVHVSDPGLERPVKDRNDNPTLNISCPQGSYGARIKRCSGNGQEPFDHISFDTYKSGPYTRSWQFFFNGQARQDMYISISDYTSKNFTGTYDSKIYFFPRTYLPKVEEKDGKIIATLPTGETVEYDADGKIIGGVLSEAGGPQPGKPAAVRYSGTGVTVRVDAKTEDPRIQDGTVEITKGTKKCTVDKRDLWPDQAKDSKLQFKFPTDSEFNSFLQKRCGFGFE